MSGYGIGLPFEASVLSTTNLNSIRVMISADQTTFIGRFDDVALVFVPEPNTIFLLGLGGMALLRQRRRQKRA